MTSSQLRVLGAARQSKTRERAISLPAQSKAIRGWAAASGAVVAKITTDGSTSGGTSAFRRRELGPWLTDPEKISAWDVLVTTKLDRACRDVADYLKLRDWCERHGKQIVLLNQPELDESTPAGRAMGTVTATFAELEREMAKQRNKERYDYMIEIGKWPGGRIPYGYRSDKDAGKLVPDDGGTAEVLRTMADMAIAGKSYGQIAEWLNGGNGTVCYLTMIRRKWQPDAVRKVLIHQNTADLLTEAKAAELRSALRNREQTRGDRVGGHMLLRVAYCRKCGGPLYCALKRDRPSGGQYRCYPCHTAIRKDKLENFAEGSLLFLCGDLEYVEYQLVAGDDHQAAIHALEKDIAALEKITGTEMVIAAKQAEIDHLRSLPFDPDHYEPVPQGITVAEHWATLDNTGKGAFMRKRGVRVIADHKAIEFHGGLLEPSEATPGYLVPVQ